MKRTARTRAAVVTAEWLGAEALAHIPYPRRREARLRAWLSRLRRVLDARRFALVAGGLLAAFGFGQAGYVQAKATLAQWLLQGAWSRSLEGRIAARPWPWADTWPVAALAAPRLGVEQIALAGASGRTLAFGPAWSPASAEPGTRGVAVYSGHRDTHFRFLRELKLGDTVAVTARGVRHVYAIDHVQVTDQRATRLAVGGDAARIALVTCWPFDAVSAGGPLRYVVEGRLVGSFADPGGA